MQGLLKYLTYFASYNNKTLICRHKKQSFFQLLELTKLKISFYIEILFRLKNCKNKAMAHSQLLWHANNKLYNIESLISKKKMGLK